MKNIDYEAERKLFLQTNKVDKYIAAEFNRIISQISPLIAADAVQAILDREMNRILSVAAERIQIVIEGGIKQAWEIANDRTFQYLDKRVASRMDIPESDRIIWYDANEKALQQYINRERGGLKLSDRVWKATDQMKELASGIEKGQSAAVVAKELRKKLVNPDVEQSPGRGVYKSPVKNAQRLARTEINTANRTADNVSWAKNPTILGYEIRVSDTTNKKVKARCPICVELAGNYPSTFKWGGWHPNCYSDDTEVMTDNGWKLFKDVLLTDKIFSLNPVTRHPEYTGISMKLQRSYKGDMVRFSSRNLDMLVTPGHPIKYINKRNNITFEEKSASEYRSTHGALYRSSEYISNDIDTISIGNHVINFDLFCEFMAYYLSEGSLSWTRKNQFHIAQCINKHNDQHGKIESVLSKLPFKYSIVGTGFYLRDHDMYEYLKQFGKSPDKHVPQEILNSSPKQIEIFLNAYVICDGHIRKSKRTFVGNRGGKFESNNREASFFTSSNQMASDIGEMLVKIGKRPSFRIRKTKGVTTEHKNGAYTGNNDMWIISECHSKTASAFNKTSEYYDGIVYDLQLSSNHIMYIRRNGKCVWGSNCLCYKIPILMSDDFFEEYLKIKREEKDTIEAVAELRKRAGSIEKIPAKTSEWLVTNKEKLDRAKSKPYWVVDNGF